MWQNFLLERGYASANLDSFTPRRISEICTDFRRLPMHDRVSDVYGALVQLAGRPDVDPQRIAVMGFSNGGVATLSALSSVVGSQLVPGSPRFRAGVALYPDCGLTSPRFYAPILVLVGELDDWTPAAECSELQRKIGPDRPAFFTHVVPNAHHAFDVINQPLQNLSNARNNYRRGGRGATIAGSWPATETAKKQIEAFLSKELHP
jgi:dienelactone hydrolase